MNYSVGRVSDAKACLLDLVHKQEVFGRAQVFRKATDGLPYAALHEYRNDRAWATLKPNWRRNVSHHGTTLEQCVRNRLVRSIDNVYFALGLNPLRKKLQPGRLGSGTRVDESEPFICRVGRGQIAAPTC